MANTYTIQVGANGYMTCLKPGAVDEGSYSIGAVIFEPSEGAPPGSGIFTLKINGGETLFANQSYTNIINGDTGIAFASVAALKAYIKTNFFRNATGGGGITTNALTFNNSGTGDASGSTFNGSAAKTLSYNSIGAQVALISGTNIKTVNGSSILGSGNLTVSAAAAGSNTQVQYNNTGALAGNSNFTFDPSTGSTYFGNPVSLPTAGGSIYFFGDSVTSGNGVTTGGTRWTTLVAASLGYTEVNNGLIGSVLEKRTPLNPMGGGSSNMIDMATNIPTYVSGTTRLLVIMFGINDWIYGGANYTPANFITDYNTVIAAAISKGWPSTSILIASQTYTNPSLYGTTGTGGGTITQANQLAFIAATSTVATTNNTLWVDVYTPMLNGGGVDNLFDTLHPNNMGHSFVSKVVLNRLKNTVYKNSQTIAVNGVSQFSSMVMFNPVLVPDANSYVLGVDSTNGNIGIANNAINLKLTNPYIIGNMVQEQAALPTTLGTKDIVLKQDTKLVATVDGFGGALFNSIKLAESSGSMEFRANFSGSTFSFFNVNGTTTALVIDASQRLKVAGASGQTVGTNGSVIGDIILKNGAALTSDASAVADGRFVPLSGSNNTEVRNYYSAGKLSFFVSGGTNGSQVESLSIFPSGRVGISTTTDDTINTLQVTGGIKATGGFNTSDATASTTFNPLIQLTNTQASTGSTDLFSPSLRFRNQLFSTTDKTLDFFITTEANSSTTVGQLLISSSLAGAAPTDLLSIDRFGNFNVKGGTFVVTNGNLNLGTAGNKILIATGSNASIGTATLVAGTVTVPTTAVTANSIIKVSYNTPGGTLASGLSAPSGSKIVGTSFVINSLTTAGVVNVADTSTVNWWIIN